MTALDPRGDHENYDRMMDDLIDNDEWGIPPIRLKRPYERPRGVHRRPALGAGSAAVPGRRARSAGPLAAAQSFPPRNGRAQQDTTNGVAHTGAATALLALRTPSRPRLNTDNPEAPMIQIKSTSGRVLFTAEHAQDVRAALREAIDRSADLRSADLRDADLSSADLRSADLSSADLRYADLSSARLSSARLRSADLSSADLRSARLRYADLRYAQGINPYRVNDLLMLLDQPGPIRAYKLVNASGEGPYNGGITYEIGKTVSVDDANPDSAVQCGAGINLATLPWCMRAWRVGYRILICEFAASDIAAIPVSDGKFRVHRAKVVGEKDLGELGLVEAADASEAA